MSPLNTASNPPNLQAFILDPHVLKTPQWPRNYSCCFPHQCWDAPPGLYKYLVEYTFWVTMFCFLARNQNGSPGFVAPIAQQIGRQPSWSAKKTYMYTESEREKIQPQMQSNDCLFLLDFGSMLVAVVQIVSGWLCLLQTILTVHITYLHFSNCQDDFMESNLDSKSGPFRNLNSTLILWMEATPSNTNTTMPGWTAMFFKWWTPVFNRPCQHATKIVVYLFVGRSHPPSFRKTIWHHLGIFGALNEIYWFPKDSLWVSNFETSLEFVRSYT